MLYWFNLLLMDFLNFFLQGHIIVIGNKSELNEKREVQFQSAMNWSAKEKGKYEYSFQV